MRRYRRPRCLKGERHAWQLGAALFADDDGILRSYPTRAHLKGTCRKCHKARAFHPNAKHEASTFKVKGHVSTLRLVFSTQQEETPRWGHLPMHQRIHEARRRNGWRPRPKAVA